MENSISILSIGHVNLKSCKNFCGESIFDYWDEDPTSHNMLVQFEDKIIITHTCGEGEGIGFVSDYHHDQSGRHIGNGIVIACEPHTKDGLLALREYLVAKSVDPYIVMATYK